MLLKMRSFVSHRTWRLSKQFCYLDFKRAWTLRRLSFEFVFFTTCEEFKIIDEKHDVRYTVRSCTFYILEFLSLLFKILLVSVDPKLLLRV